MKKHPFLHDHFFKSFFQIREIALEHVEDYVPPEIATHLVLPTFGLDQTVYMNKELEESRSDLVYGCQLDTGQNCRFAILHEHKSKQPERDIRVQTLQYKTSIWSMDEQQNRPLTFVLPSVIFNGRKRWKKQQFRDSFPGLPEAFLPFLAEFEFLLLDLPSMSDEEIIRRSEGKILASGFLAMKHARQPEYFRKNFTKVFNFDWQKYAAPIWQTFMSAMLSYISSATGFTNKDFRDLAKPLPAALNQFTMMTMESILEEGRKEGIAIGMEKGMEKGLEKGLEKGMEKGMEKGLEKKANEFAMFLLITFPDYSDEKIASITGLPKAAVANLRKELKDKPSNGQNGNS